MPVQFSTSKILNGRHSLKTKNSPFFSCNT
ncbi:hypothetical protein CsSME_00024719 [Camellia sinensis var. sinensis]